MHTPHKVRYSCMYDTGEERPWRAVRLSRVAIVKYTPLKIH